MHSFATPHLHSWRSRTLCGLLAICFILCSHTALAASEKWGSFIVEAEPPDADVRFLRIKYRYKPGMILEQGSYIIEVSKPGFEPVLKEVTIEPGKRNVVRVNLHDPQGGAAPEPDQQQPAPNADQTGQDAVQGQQSQQQQQDQQDLRIPLSQTLSDATSDPQTATPLPQEPDSQQPADQAFSSQLPPAPEQSAPAQSADQEAVPDLDVTQSQSDTGAAAETPADESQADASLPEIDENNPPSPEELMQVSNHLAQAGDLPNAIKGFSLVLQQQPKNVNAFVGRGFSYYKLGNFAQAVEDFTAALQLDDQHLSAWYHRGNAYLMAGEYEKAIQDYEKALQLSATIPDLYNARGTALYKLGRYEEAIMDFDRSIALDPRYADAYFNRGSCYLQQGKEQLALDDFNKVLEINPQDALALQKKKAAQKALRP